MSAFDATNGNGEAVDETGLLIRKGGAFVLRRDVGGLFRLELQRVPVDLVEKRVRVIGRMLFDDAVSVDGIAGI